MKRFLILVFFFLVLGNLRGNAQGNKELTGEIREALDYAFENVDLQKVPTGILSDYGIETIPLSYYSGRKGISQILPPIYFLSFYDGLYSCIVDKSKVNLPTPQEIKEKCSALKTSIETEEIIPIAVVMTPYNRVDSLALRKGTLHLQNKQLYEVPGSPSPYYTKYCVAAVPFHPELKRKHIALSFPDDLLFNNMKTDLASISISFNNNADFITTKYWRRISHTYPTYGTKKITIRFNLKNKSHFYAYISLDLKDPEQLELQMQNEQRDADLLRQASESLWGAIDTHNFTTTEHHSGGRIEISYAKERARDRRILKPLIIAEGFDVSSAYKERKERNRKNNTLTSLTSLYNTGDRAFIVWQFWRKVKEEGYDVIYLDYNNGMDDIRRNAALLEEVIRYVNREKEKNSRYYKQAHKEPNVVMGLSMGGLVAAYALRSMELKGEEHETSKFISYDSPHYGATVPFSALILAKHVLTNPYLSAAYNMHLQKLLNQFHQPLNFPYKLNEIETVLESPAAKQMLEINSGLSTETIRSLDSELRKSGSRYAPPALPVVMSNHHPFKDFMTEYHDRGLPQKCYCIAFSNGMDADKLLPLNGPYATVSVNAQLFQCLHPLFEWLASLNLFGSPTGDLVVPMILPGIAYFNGSIGLVPNRLSTSVTEKMYECNITYEKRLFYDIIVPISRMSLCKPQNMMYYYDESAPGSCYSAGDDVSNKIYSFNKLLGALFVDLTANGVLYLGNLSFCFVNKSSALGYSPWSDRSDFYRTYAVRKDKSEEHIVIDYHADTLLYELRNVPQIDFKPIIKGPVNVTGEQATYRVANHAEGMNYRWITCFENFYFHDSERSSLDYLRQTGTEPTFTVHFGKRKSDRAMIRLAYEKPDLTRDTVSYPILIGLPNAQYLTATQLQGEFVRLEQKPESSQTVLLPTVQLTWKGHGNITGIECKARFANGSGEEVPLKDVSIWDIRDWYTFSGYATSGGDNNELLLYKENLSPQSGDVRIGFTPTPDGDHLNFASNGADTDLDWGGGDGINPPYVPEDLAEITYHRKCTCAPLLNQEQDAVSFYLAPLLRNDLNARSVNLSFRVRNAAGYSDWTPELTYRIEGPFDWHVVPTRVTDSDARIVLNGDQCKDSEGNPIRLLVRIYNRNWQEMLRRTISAGEGIGIDLLSPGTYIVTVQRYLKDGSLSFSPSAGQVVIKE